MTESEMTDFWQWLTRELLISLQAAGLIMLSTDAEVMANKNGLTYEKFDFAYRGVLSIVKGFVPLGYAGGSATTPTPSQLALSSISIAESSPPNQEPSSTRTRQRTLDTNRSMNDSTFTNLVDKFNTDNHIDTYVKVSGNRLARRKLALALCRPDFALSDMTTAIKR